MRKGKGAWLLRLAAAGLIYLGLEFQINTIISPAIALAGILILWRAAHIIMHGQLVTLDRQSGRQQSYTGPVTYVIGLALILAGGALLVFSVFFWLQPGLAQLVAQALINTRQGWGMLLLAFGIFPLLFGLVDLMAGSAYRAEQRTSMLDLGFRLGGLLSMAAGAVLLMVGLWLIIN